MTEDLLSSTTIEDQTQTTTEEANRGNSAEETKKCCERNKMSHLRLMFHFYNFCGASFASCFFGMYYVFSSINDEPQCEDMVNVHYGLRVYFAGVVIVALCVYSFKSFACTIISIFLVSCFFFQTQTFQK